VQGQHYETARKLGALFQSLLSQTPELLKAYGCRVAQISEESTVNPAGNAKHGVFASFAGIDANVNMDRCDIRPGETRGTYPCFYISSDLYAWRSNFTLGGDR
jgi:hypothetical protein